MPAISLQPDCSPLRPFSVQLVLAGPSWPAEEEIEMTKLEQLGLKSAGAAATVTLSKKSSPGDGSFGRGVKGCGGPILCS
jgi:hypothetical protein